jgi:hypothetical protein
MQRMQNKRNKSKQSRRNCKMKQQFYGQLLLFFVTEKQQQQKINFYGGATTNYKKNKGQGFYIFLHTKLSSFTILSALSRVWGFVWSVYKLSVKIGKLLQKKNQFGFNFKGNYC